MKKTITIYAAQKNTDQTEGRGSMVDVYYTTTKALAYKIVNSPTFYKKYGVQGCPPYDGGKYDVKEQHITCIDSFEEFLQLEKDTETLTALNKLTEKEKELLGLK